jgi:DNA-binding MarR family transcriptional regulator
MKVLMKDGSQGTELFERWARIMNKMSRSESIPCSFGTSDLLFPSEIHTICVIGIMPGINITDLSVKLGITKGAVSKMAGKLVEKGLIEKYRNPGNEKEIFLRLTGRGTSAYLGHELNHQKAFAGIIREVEGMTGEQAAALFRFLEMVEDVIDTCIREKESGGDGIPQVNRVVE